MLGLCPSAGTACYLGRSTDCSGSVMSSKVQAMLLFYSQVGMSYTPSCPARRAARRERYGKHGANFPSDSYQESKRGQGDQPAKPRVLPSSRSSSNTLLLHSLPGTVVPAPVPSMWGEHAWITTAMCCWCFSTSEKGISRCCAQKDETPKAPSPPANLQLIMSSGKSQEGTRCCDPEQCS